MKTLLNKMSRKRGQDLTNTQNDRMFHLYSTRLFIHAPSTQYTPIYTSFDAH